MKTNTIKISKVIIASLLFLLITIIKLMFPGQAESFCNGLKETVNFNYDYEEAFEELGRNISDGSLIRALSVWGKPDSEEAEETVFAQEYQPVTLNELRAEHTSVLPENTIHAEYSALEPSEDEGTELEEESLPEAVAAFLEAQSAYSDYDVPANVNFDMPELPFEYSQPVSAELSSGFGYRYHPLLNEIKFHYGTDLAACSGDEIYSFSDGAVSMTGYDEGYGNYVIIDHDDGWQTLYAHCSTVYVNCGQSVSLGEKIALVGDTGDVTGPHLHFEIRKDGIYYNSGYYLA